MPRLDAMSEVVRKVLLSFPCLEPTDAPWTAPPAPARPTVALVTTARLHLRGDRPFILYVCSWLFRGTTFEPAFTERWIQAIRSSGDARTRSGMSSTAL